MPGQQRYRPAYGMDRGARMWILRTAQKHLWRMVGWYSLEDLIQDGYLQYSRIVAKYPHVTMIKHRMALLKVTYLHHLDDLAKRRTRLTEVNESSLLRAGQVTSPFADLPEITASDLLAKAPAVVTRLLAVISTEAGRRALRALYRYRADGTRETVGERWGRLTGLEAGTDFEMVCRAYLGPPVGPPTTTLITKRTRRRPAAWTEDHLRALGCTPEQIARHVAGWLQLEK